MDLMMNNHIRQLTVMEEDQLVGIISVGDVVKIMMEELEYHSVQHTCCFTGLRKVIQSINLQSQKVFPVVGFDRLS